MCRCKNRKVEQNTGRQIRQFFTPNCQPGSRSAQLPPRRQAHQYPHVGMVDTHSDGMEGKTVWQYDPHTDPALQFDSQRSTIENLIDEALASGAKTACKQRWSS